MIPRPSGCGQVRVVKLRRGDEPRRRRWPALPAARRGDPRRGTRPGPASNQVPGNQAPRSRAEGMRILPAGRQIIPRFTVCCGHGNLNRTAAKSESRRDNVDALVLAPASTAVAQSHRQIGDAHRPAGFHSVPVLTNPRNAGEAARNCNATYRGFRLCDWQRILVRIFHPSMVCAAAGSSVKTQGRTGGRGRRAGIGKKSGPRRAPFRAIWRRDCNKQTMPFLGAIAVTFQL